MDKPQILDRFHSETRWTKPLRSWPEAESFTRQQLCQKAEKVGASMLLFDRAEVQETDEYITLSVYAQAWAGDTRELLRQIEREAPGAALPVGP
jgi:hypothetical protein